MPFGEPKFPIVNEDPELDDCINSMRPGDFFTLAGMTSACWAYGYVLGKPARMPTALTAATIGFTAATFVVVQDTRARLLGYSENQPEVKKFGFVRSPIIREPQDRRFPTALKPSEASRQTLNWNNYK